MEILIPIVAAVAGIIAGAGGIFAYNKKNEKGGKDKADDLVRKAKREAQDIVLSAKKEATAIAEKNQAEENERRREWKRTENRLAERETTLDAKLDQLEKKSDKLNKETREIEDLKNDEEFKEELNDDKLDNESKDDEIKNELISINKATIEELTTLSGIGESKAKAIIEYRNKNGEFKSIDDIKNVSGIGDSLFEKIKNSITI